MERGNTARMKAMPAEPPRRGPRVSYITGVR